MPSYRRYVAIGDSSTEGLEDPDGHGGYRGWADRLAQHLADAQDAPLEYANLAVRGRRMADIREGQFDQAMALQPDLMTIFGGVNDLLSADRDLGRIRTAYAEMFAAAQAGGVRVLTFTVPDPAKVNGLARPLRRAAATLNDIIRTEGGRHGVLVMDFADSHWSVDPRLWFEDRLHSSPLGHALVAGALAWRLGVPGFGPDWGAPLDRDAPRSSWRNRIAGDVRWLRRHLIPFLVWKARRLPFGAGIEPKHPVPVVVAKSSLVSSPTERPQ